MMTQKNTASLYLLGLKTEDPLDSSTWDKIPWVVIMFGVAIVYNLIFRKAKVPDETKTPGYYGRNKPSSYSQTHN